MSMLKIDDYDFPRGWRDAADSAARARFYAEELEGGKVLFFDNIPYDLPQADREFLLAQKQTGSSFHKNISYRPKQNAIRGLSADSSADARRLRDIMQFYSAETTRFLYDFLKPYDRKLALDFASFRPLEEKGRDLSPKKRNDLLHVDSFPTRPTKGARILRVFTNINPNISRVWNVAEPFDLLAARYAEKAGLQKFAAKSTFDFSKILRSVGVPLADYSAYDKFMLNFHDYLKANDDFQANGDKVKLEFPPGSTWMVYTDGVPHAALSGQFALEQTYIVPLNALVAERKSPLRILEKICAVKLAD